MQDITCVSIEDYVHQIANLHRADLTFWFRGEPGAAVPTARPLLPRLWRVPGRDENALNQLFRMRAPTYSASGAPAREHTDQWLFLAQHMGLSTRLLDWTESAMAALYFALRTEDPVVWVLDPQGLNALSGPKRREFPLTWEDSENKTAIGNIALAWGDNKDSAVDLPVAIYPTNIHPRMSVQRSCFTVHGRSITSLLTQLEATGDMHVLIARIDFQMSRDTRLRALDFLRVLGVAADTLFPDLPGLAIDVDEWERPLFMRERPDDD